MGGALGAAYRSSMGKGNWGVGYQPTLPTGGWQTTSGRGGSSVPAAGTSSNIEMPVAQQYNPYQWGQGGMLGQNIGAVSGYGQQLMEPGSDYYQRLMAQMREQIGGQAAASQRAAAVRAAYGGMGGGTSPELLAAQSEIAQSGLGAMGQGAAGFALQAPQLGMQALQGTFSPLLGIEQLGEQSKQFGAGQSEQARQFGVGVGLQQQQLAAQNAWQQAQLQQQYQQMLANQQMQREQMYYNMMAGMMGGLG